MCESNTNVCGEGTGEQHKQDIFFVLFSCHKNLYKIKNINVSIESIPKWWVWHSKVVKSSYRILEFVLS